MRLVSWNVAGRKGKLDAQAAALVACEPDLVALQEIRSATAPRWRQLLVGSGLRHIADTVDRLDGRRYCNLIASRWPLDVLPALAIPYPERVLSVQLETSSGTLDLHNAHLPPGVTRGLRKIETFEAIS